MSKQQSITNSQAALEFFADVLLIKGIISPQEESAILDAKTIADLDDILESMYAEESGDE